MQKTVVGGADFVKKFRKPVGRVKFTMNHYVIQSTILFAPGYFFFFFGRHICHNNSHENNIYNNILQRKT